MHPDFTMILESNPDIKEHWDNLAPTLLDIPEHVLFSDIAGLTLALCSAVVARTPDNTPISLSDAVSLIAVILAEEVPDSTEDATLVRGITFATVLLYVHKYGGGLILTTIDTIRQDLSTQHSE